MIGDKRRFWVRKMEPWSALRRDSNRLDSREKNCFFFSLCDDHDWWYIHPLCSDAVPLFNMH
jgi:hypothetical protein